MPSSRLLALLPALAAMSSALVLGPAWATPGGEYALKAAYLYNFALYTEWPAASAEPFNLCVLGEDPFGSALDGIAHKTLNGRRIVIHRVRAVEATHLCHLLFIATSAHGEWADVGRRLDNAPILTVAEAGDHDRARVMIVLRVEHDRVVFDVNQALARQAGLRFSSKLLRLARGVY